MIFFSTLCSSSSGVLIGTGGVSFALYLVGAIPKLTGYLPTMLTDSVALIYGTKAVDEYIPSLIITLVTGALFFAMSIPVFNKKQL
jgi:ABC-2 type transport system permease protein